jgi:predicted dienelactone hydrolase
VLRGEHALEPASALADARSEPYVPARGTLALMKYDPFARGQYPVAVQSAELHDRGRADRAVALEIWYPAAASERNRDLTPESQDSYTIFGAHRVRQEAVRDAPADGSRFPLVLFSHGMAGHRRQSSFFCTHLASHGYVVIAPDHGGSTVTDLVGVAMRLRMGGAIPADIEALLGRYVADRPLDLAFILDAIEARTLALPSPIDPARVALSGHSFGGFTALALAAIDARVKHVLALAPAGGAGPLASEALTAALAVDGARHVPTLYLALGRDSLLPLDGIVGLFRRAPEQSRMFVLPEADHMHFCDRAENSHEFFRSLPPSGLFGELMKTLPPFSQLVAAEHGYAFANALGLAALDETLLASEHARAFLEQAVTEFAKRGIQIRAVAASDA